MLVCTLLHVAVMVPPHNQFLCAPGSTAPPSSSVTSWLKSIELDAARARAGVRASTSKLARCTHAIECVQRAQAYSMLVVDLYRTYTGLSLLSSTSMQVTLFAFEVCVSSRHPARITLHRDSSSVKRKSQRAPCKSGLACWD